jgi:AbrB family looped-hinge helix DNA binding protein
MAAPVTVSLPDSVPAEASKAAKRQVAKVTGKGQITIPAETRKLLGVKPGDTVVFEQSSEGITVVRQDDENGIEKMRGIGNWLPPGYEGREGIIRYFRELRGHDEIDDQIFGTE